MNQNTIQQELARSATEDLFLMMAMKDDPEQFRHGYLEFYRRYAEFLRRTIHDICSYYNLFTGEIEEVLFDNTINRIVEKADKFIKIEQVTNPQHKDNRIKSWLGKIAENELKQLMRKGENDSLIFVKLDSLERFKNNNDDEDIGENEPEEFVFDDSPSESRLTPEELKWFHEGFALLSQTQRYVINQIYLRKSDSTYLESQILDDLAITLKITKDSVRQIHYRAKQIIKQHINTQKSKMYEQFRRPPNDERRNL